MFGACRVSKCMSSVLPASKNYLLIVAHLLAMVTAVCNNDILSSAEGLAIYRMMSFAKDELGMISSSCGLNLR